MVDGSKDETYLPFFPSFLSESFSSAFAVFPFFPPMEQVFVVPLDVFSTLESHFDPSPQGQFFLFAFFAFLKPLPTTAEPILPLEFPCACAFGRSFYMPPPSSSSALTFSSFFSSSPDRQSNPFGENPLGVYFQIRGACLILLVLQVPVSRLL